MFSCEYREIWKESYFEEHLWTAAFLESVLWERFQDQNLAKETTDDLLCQVSQDWAKMFPKIKY